MATTPFGSTYAVIGGLNLAATEDSGVIWALKMIDGLGATGGTLSPTQKPRSAGSWAGDSFSKARTIVLSGTMVAPSTALALNARDRLNNAVSLATSVLTIVELGATRTANVRRDGDVMITWVNNSAFSWSIQLAALDPRLFGTPLVGATGLPATSGGLTIPVVVPFVVNSTVNSGLVSLTNPGNEEGPVVLRIDGPCTGPVITHAGSGNSLVFSSSLVLGVGEFLLIDMEARTVLANGQSSRNGYITSRGWSQFDPGANTWYFTAAGYNAASLLTVTAAPAWK